MDFEIFSDGNEDLHQRLAERHKRIVLANVDAFQGKSILDIAANNGRWTYAALMAGAKHVTSIEGRKDRAGDAVTFLNQNGLEGKHSTNVGDMYDFLYDNRESQFDTVLCLGIYYHVMDHYHFLKSICRTNPNTIIIDSGFVRSFRNSVHIQFEDPSKHLNALSVFAGQKSEPVGFVSLGLMIQMAWNFGYDCRPVEWNPGDIGDKSVVHDYMMGRRFTLRLNKMDGRYDKDWKAHWESALTLIKKDFSLLMDPKTHDSIMDERARKPMESTVFTIFE